MRLTSSFAVFRADPSEQGLARARWLAREGRVDAAEEAYRSELRSHPDVAAGWIELVELLRQGGRHDAALATALEAEEHFGPAAALPLVLKGAALSELGRTRDAIRALEAALERDGNNALAWHELAYAAYKVGEYSRALLALDRAFALEPHTDTLMLRGRILREAGQYEAAEVAFEAAQQATEHDIPQREAARECAATRRAAALGGKRPSRFSAREKVFVDTGAATIEPAPSGPPDAYLLARCLASLPSLVHRVGWHPAVVAGATATDGALARSIAHSLGLEAELVGAVDPADQPLIVTVCNDASAEWGRQIGRLERWGAGTTFALVQLPAVDDAADIVGTICAADPAAVAAIAVEALQLTVADGADIDEAALLAACPRAPWRQRRASGAAE